MNKKQYIKWSLLFIFITLIPYIIDLILTPTGMKFSGLISSSLDHISYLEKINNGRLLGSLEFLVRSNYQNIDLHGGYIFLLYSGAGLLLGKLFTASSIYFILRILGIIFFLISFYFFQKEFLKEKYQKTFTILTLFSAPVTMCVAYLYMIFGGTITSFNSMPKEIFIFTSSLYTPHFIIEIGLMLLSLIAINKFKNNPVKYSIYNGLILLLISLIHPQVAVFIGGIEGIFILTEIKNRSYKIKDLLPVSLWGLIPLPYLIYCLKIFNTLPTLTSWLGKNIYPITPDVFILIFLPIILTCMYCFFRKKEVIKENKLIFFWLVGIIAILIMPKQFQGKLQTGIIIPLVYFLSILLEDLKNNKIFKRAIAIAMVICMLPGTLEMALPNRSDSLAYYPEYYEDLFKDIEELDDESIIFSNLYTSAFMLANTSKIFPLSNRDESAKFEEYTKLYEQGLKEKDLSFLEDLNINYYVYDRTIAKENDTVKLEENLPYKKVKETENYIIYKIR